MRHITTCPACAVAFRVTDEQLAVRGGYVRCGRCQGVFDAYATLVAEPQPETLGAAPGFAQDPETPAPREPFRESGSDENTGAEYAAVSQPEPVEITVEPAPQAEVHAYEVFPPAPHEQVAVVALEKSAVTESLGHGLVEQESEDTHRDRAAEALPSSAVPIEELKVGGPPQTLPESASAPLPFGRALRRQRRAIEWAWGVAALLLTAALAAQTAYFYRAELAGALPEVKPWLEQACAWLRCTVPPPGNATLLSIESSDLQMEKGVPNLLILNATLRNRAAYAQRYPSIELTLIDSEERAIVRRVVEPREYLGDGTAQEVSFAANTERLLRLYIDATAVRVAGYRLYLFYPRA